MSNSSKLDAAQIVKRAFDEDKRSFRVDAQVNATIGDIKIEDEQGNNLKVNNDGSIDVNIKNELELSLDALSGDSVLVSDGLNLLKINTDGSLNFNSIDSNIVTNLFNETTAVPSLTPTVLFNHTVNENKKLIAISVSGTNIAAYEILIDNELAAKKYTYFGSPMNVDFNMYSLNLTNGQNLKVIVQHNRPYVGDFNCNVILKQA